MLKKSVIIIAFMTIISLSSCFQSFICIHGNGNIVSEHRVTGSFSGISNSTSIDVFFNIADTAGITIEVEENLLDYIETGIHNNILEIDTREGINCLDFTETCRIIITAPSIGEISLSGSGNFIAEALDGAFVSVRSTGSGNIAVDDILSDNCEIRLSGSGDVQIKNTDCSSLETRISGSGDLNIKGIANTADITTSGSGDNYAQNLLLQKAFITISGSGNVYTTVENQLNAKISGSGNIYLKGNPIVYENITGSGRIIEY